MSIKHIISDIKEHFNGESIKVAELGILHGESIPIILNNLNVAEYHGVDLFDCYEENMDGSYELMKNQGNEIYNKISQQYYSDKRINIIKGLTNETVNNYSDNYFDLIFIDAGHEYPEVSEDIRLWYPKMKSKGLFCGDDYFYPPVKQATQEFISKHNFKLYNSAEKNPDPNYNDYWTWYIKT